MREKRFARIRIGEPSFTKLTYVVERERERERGERERREREERETVLFSHSPPSEKKI